MRKIITLFFTILLLCLTSCYHNKSKLNNDSYIILPANESQYKNLPAKYKKYSRMKLFKLCEQYALLPPSNALRKEAFIISYPLALKGDYLFESSLSFLYEAGIGVKRDLNKAKYWKEKSEKNEDNLFTRSLIKTFEFYRVIDKCQFTDNNKALSYAEDKAFDGNQSAQNSLFFIYEVGSGGKKQSYEKVYQLAERFEKYGNPKALYYIGTFYEKGIRNYPKDYIKAYVYYNISAQKNNKDAEKARDLLELKMSPEMIGDAQKLSYIKVNEIKEQKELIEKLKKEEQINKVKRGKALKNADPEIFNYFNNMSIKELKKEMVKEENYTNEDKSYLIEAIYSQKLKEKLKQSGGLGGLIEYYEKNEN